MNRKLFYTQWVIVSCLLILVGLLAVQNYSLKSKLNEVHVNSKSSKSRMFELKLKKNLLLKSIPFKINLKDCHFHTENITNETSGQILVVFDLTVCGKCLKKGLLAMKYFQEAALNKGLQYTALIGVKSRQEDARVIDLYREGLLNFPCKTIDVRVLYEKFHLSSDKFLDTPFFVFMDNEKKVLDVFKPVQYEVKELMQWLDTLTS